MEMLSFSGNRPNTIVLADAAWLIHKNFNAVKLSTKIDGVEVATGHLYGTSRLVQSLMLRRDWSLVYCMDEIPLKKQALVNDYKSERSEKKFNLGQVMNDLENLVTSLPGVYSARSVGNEADDVLATLADRFNRVGIEVIIYTGDNDLLPMIGSKCKIVRKLTKDKTEYIDQDYVKDLYGIDSSGVALYKVLMGCDSDHVAPLQGMTKDKALKIIKEYNGGVDLFFKRDWKSEAGKAEAFKNFQLTNLNRSVKVELIKKSIKEGLEVARRYKLRAMESMLSSMIVQTGIKEMI